MAENYMNPMEAANDNGCLDWNATITNDGAEFLILPEGDYVFQVVDFERARHGGSPKVPPCNKAILTLEIKTAEGVARARTVLFLHRNAEWKISSFFRAIGLKTKGTEIQMDWSKVLGAWGRAHIRPGSYDGNDGEKRQTNEVARFLDYDPEKVKPGFTDVTGMTDDLPF